MKKDKEEELRVREKRSGNEIEMTLINHRITDAPNPRQAIFSVEDTTDMRSEVKINSIVTMSN